MARNSEVLGSNPVRVECLSPGCSYTVLQTVQRPGMCSVVYGMCTIKNPLGHSITVGHSFDFELSSVDITMIVQKIA